MHTAHTTVVLEKPKLLMRAEQEAVRQELDYQI
jgi:hypothetical protein